jgi:hypothetical protein
MQKLRNLCSTPFHKFQHDPTTARRVKLYQCVIMHHAISMYGGMKVQQHILVTVVLDGAEGSGS